jgi:hypothetical protein
MLKNFVRSLLILITFSLTGSLSYSQQRVETRCGWFENPTPANAWLVDKNGEWTIGIQGGYQADGDWPNIPERQWVATNNTYGYGCACIKGSFDRKQGRVINIVNSRARPLSACRGDAAIKRKEPK